jgi:hypothetical protein
VNTTAPRQAADGRTRSTGAGDALARADGLPLGDGLSLGDGLTAGAVALGDGPDNGDTGAGVQAASAVTVRLRVAM